MKSINNIFSAKNISVLALLIIGVFFSCQNNSDILDSTDTQNINSFLASSAYFNEGSDISANVLNGLTVSQYSGARVESDTIIGLVKYDSRLSCAGVSISRSGTPGMPAGTIIVDYGTSSGCVDSSGVTRLGKIIITYSGKRWAVGSYISIQFENFYRNYSHIEGTLKDSVSVNTDTTNLQFISKLEGGKVTFGDGKSVTRTHMLTRIWHRSLIRINSEWQISGYVGGQNDQNKNGSVYQVEITSPLIYRVACVTKKVFVPVKGGENITVTSSGSKEYPIDFGDGTCDNYITVNKEKTIEVTPDGN